MSDEIDNASWFRRELIEIVREEIGFNEVFATQAGVVLLYGLRRRLGGSAIYIPSPDTRTRDDVIREAFDGRSVEDVMREFWSSSLTGRK